MMTSPSPSPLQGQCANCHACHPSPRGHHQPNCCLLTIRRSGRGPVSASSSLPMTFNTTILLPANMEGRNAVRDMVWMEFDSIKVENEYSRQQMASRRQSRKGDLRAEAPIPWLRWRSARGEEGQTRKKENFEKVWARATQGAAYITCTFLSALSHHHADNDDDGGALEETVHEAAAGNSACSSNSSDCGSSSWDTFSNFSDQSMPSFSYPTWQNAYPAQPWGKCGLNNPGFLLFS